MPTLMDVCELLEVEADYILFGKISNAENHPLNSLLQQLTPQQRFYAEEILSAYVKACLNQ
jgi:hypothetical protein